MPEYARIVNNSVIEIREMDQPPAHKAALWTPVERSGSGEIVSTQIDGNLVRITRTPKPLSALKTELRTRVDTDAESCRSKFITPGAGQMLTYQEKHTQARAAAALGETAANALTEEERFDQFPTLAASVGIEASTLFACAQLVIARYEAFADLSHVIEKKRLQGKKAISDASDAAAAQAAYEAITWPTP